MWLVVWNVEHFCFPYFENFIIPTGLSCFSEGLKPPTSIYLYIYIYTYYLYVIVVCWAIGPIIVRGFFIYIYTYTLYIYIYKDEMDEKGIIMGESWYLDYCIWIWICMSCIVWMNYDDLTPVTSLEWCLVREIIPKWSFENSYVQVSALVWFSQIYVFVETTLIFNICVRNNA